MDSPAHHLTAQRLLAGLVAAAVAAATLTACFWQPQRRDGRQQGRQAGATDPNAGGTMDPNAGGGMDPNTAGAYGPADPNAQARQGLPQAGQGRQGGGQQRWGQGAQPQGPGAGGQGRWGAGGKPRGGQGGGGARPAAEVDLSEFLCCGQTTGGTRIWGVSYPRGWNVVLLPNNPQAFFGALFMDPSSTVVVAYIPAATTVPGAVTDVGEVDLFLNRLVTERQQEFRGFREIQRQPLQGVPNGRLWAGTWPGQDDQMWESLIVAVSPTNLENVIPGMPRGNLTMMGVRASSRDWARGQAIYDRLVASTKTRRLDSGGSAAGGWSQGDASGGIGRPSVSPGMVRFCPAHCDWIWVGADQPGWRCPNDGYATEPYETPCVVIRRQ